MSTPSTLAVVESVLDEGRLSALVGRTVRAARLRVKPDVSLTVGLEHPGTGRPVGWARLLWPVSRVKADNAARRARRHGRRTEQYELGDGMILQLGRLAADPALVEHTDAAARRAVALEPDDARVLRYNPLRRLVMQTAVGVVRITSTPQDDEILLRDLIEGRVPVPERVRLPGTETGPPVHVSALRLVGDGDLGRVTSLRATAAAGAGLAALHALTGRLPAEAARRLPGSRPAGRRPEAAHISILRALAPPLAARVEALGRRLPALPRGRQVLAHGDFTPDQVLVRLEDDAVWLTDFDRSRLAPAELDLGSYLAVVDPETGAALLRGYADAGGDLPDGAGLRAGIAHARMARLVEPLRHADPLWRTRIDQALGELEETCAAH